MARTFNFARWLALVFALVVTQSPAMTASEMGFSKSARVYLNPDTGRFWSMDSHEGFKRRPLSLHKYLLGSDNPVNRIDPSGHNDLTLTSLSLAGGISGAIEGFAMPVTTRAVSWAAFRVVTAAIAIGAGLAGDRGGSMMLYHYDALDEFQVTGFPPGTWLTDRGDFSFSEALSITYQSGSRLFLYGVAIKSPSEIEPFPPIRPSVNQCRTTGYLPPIRVNIIKTLYGPNWSGPMD